MRHFRSYLSILGHQLAGSFSSGRTLAGYLVGIVSTLVTSYNYNRFAASHTISLPEVFIQHYMTVGGVTVMLLGLMLVLSEAPFVRTDSFMMIHRAGRKHWYRAMWGYMTVQTCLYYFVSLLSSLVFVLPKTYVHNVWSLPLQNMIRYDQMIVMEKFHMAIPNGPLLDEFTPYSALLHTFLLLVLYSVLLGGLLFALNLYTHVPAGTIAAAAVHLLSFLCSDSFLFPGMARWSFMTNAMLDTHGGSDGLPLAFSYMLFCFCLILVYDIGRIFIRHTEFYIIGDDADA